MNRAIHKRKPGWVFFSRFKSDIRTVPKREESEHYEKIKTVIRGEKKAKFKNIFLGVSLINVTTFLFTLSNYYAKADENYYDVNDIGVVDHVVLTDFVSSMGVNNLPVYLKNRFFHKLVKSVQDENYSFKENALLGLLELFYKNKSAFTKIEKENKEEHAEFIKYIFAKLEEDANLEYTKKKIYSSILFYYIKHSDNNLSMSYEHIQEIVNNPNLFYNLQQREEIISYLLLKIVKNEKNIAEIYAKEKEFIETYTSEAESTYHPELVDDEAKKKKKNSYIPIIQFLISQKGENTRGAKSMWDFYYTMKKNNEDYYKQECLTLLQSYFEKINSPFCIDNNDVCVKMKNSYNSIMNKIYLKYLENTVIYTFFFSFVLHNINAKEYTLMNYLFSAKDIFRSVYSNCLINAMLLAQKSITQNLSMRADEQSCIIAAFLFNQLNSLAFSASLYKCKYALVPLLFSQIVKDNFFL
ncbi:conserved Plasmodium protein, unknown function [Plasmodium knowlesi strain H]|uniref:Uncharacterized protein n=2 Tax=Plasmodium knowlesi (strain H) TaxID=5851 RepID=A0A5E7X4Z5_PLAKH|nr:conserved Plasmodium protein, unknown function [Plasmodium knowlesi strain H]CAA9989940.1 conserved Plasmodium protein, unknown function [Plasmodium knowlesi strain H]SBO24517.1 conserved Plasmodium protein, unknown function [Plasmodium knowlesi strain H]SBO26431.1 conserved Plasmodium protein, unknown function [Plasmodium knowlesi strain H]VVS79414.1 conserved Plasmodium protein, unknown function [Plasmodium knowlesi strain H]